MKTLLSIFCFFSSALHAQPYAGLEGSLHASLTTNAHLLTISRNGFIPGGDVVAVGYGRSAALLVGYRHKTWWLESGLGIYRTPATHSVISPGLSPGWRGYRNVHVPIQSLDIPVRLGYTFFGRSKTRVSPYVGARFLFDRMKQNRGWEGYAGDVALEVRNNNPYKHPATYTLFLSHYSYSVILLNPGIRYEYSVAPRVDISADAHFTLGFRVLQSSAMYVTQYRDGVSVNGHSFGSTKGDALGISLGVRYRFGVEQQKEADPKPRR